MKVCKNCNKEFKPLHESRGQEQVYCSIKCRQTSAHLRSINKIKQSVIHENENQRITGTEQIGTTESMDRIGRAISETNERRGDNTNNNLPNYKESGVLEGNNIRFPINGIQESHINLIRELYESKSETIFYKLKLEQVEKELNELRIENARLESELDEYESEGEEESNYSGMLGSVMEQYKEDPINTINFASELIGNLFKPKKNETSIKS
jgi:hypothetical protein